MLWNFLCSLFGSYRPDSFVAAAEAACVCESVCVCQSLECVTVKAAWFLFARPSHYSHSHRKAERRRAALTPPS